MRSATTASVCVECSSPRPIRLVAQAHRVSRGRPTPGPPTFGTMGGVPAPKRRTTAVRVILLALALVLPAGCGALTGRQAGETPAPRTVRADRSPEPSTSAARGERTQRPSRQASPSERARAARPLSWGPTRAEWAQARRIVAGMSPAEKAGQVIVAGFQGTKAPLSLVRDYHVGGVIVMGYNVESTSQVRSVNLALQEEARRQGRGWPLVTSVDQEGGRIARVREPLTEFPTYMSVGAARDPKLARSLAEASGTELRALGFTTVFAPDADVTSGPDDPTIGSRSAGSDPRLVSEIVKGSLRGYADAGIVAVPKHFPGHGSVPADSHLSLPVQQKALAGLAARDLVPFEAAVDAGAPAVMVAHIDVRHLDPGTPSSVSRPVVDGLLRERLGFEGAVVTDALEMAGVAEKYGSAEAGVRALLAGADILLLPAVASDLHTAIVRALKSGRLPQARLDEAAARSVALMLHQEAAGPAPSTAVLGKASQASYTASLRGLTVASGRCTGRLVGREVRLMGGKESDRTRFRAAARAAGITVGDSGNVVRLLNSGGSSGSGDVVVALDTPYGLGRSDAETARIALYGRTPEAYQALVDVLAGTARGGGKLPVAVDGLRAGAGCG